VTTFVHTGLTTGAIYDYKVLAINFNGKGAMSPALRTYACVFPSGIAAPVRVPAIST